MSTAPPDLRVRQLRVSEHARAAAAYAHVLDAEERARAAAFHRPEDRDAYLVAHVTVRRLLSETLGTAPQDVEIVRRPCHGCGGAHGRPAVPGDPVHFSLSHTRGMVAVVLADVPVGVDVEETAGAEVVGEISPLLHPDERAELAALPPEARPAAFARCWTRKEAYLKATGAGLTESLATAYVGTGAVPAAPPGHLLTDHPAPPGYATATAHRIADT